MAETSEPKDPGDGSQLLLLLRRRSSTPHSDDGTRGAMAELLRDAGQTALVGPHEGASVGCGEVGAEGLRDGCFLPFFCWKRGSGSQTG
eukprot:COSAG04_NODE_5471_length_1604_cov_2.278405_2_plen_89_part_00